MKDKMSKMGAGQFANMPQKEVMKEYPSESYGSSPKINDTITRLDSDAKHNAKAGRRSIEKGMY